MHINKIFALLLSAVLLSSCGRKGRSYQPNELDKKMDKIADDYVKLVLRVGQLNNNYVDAYYGPDNFKPNDSLKTHEDSTKVISECSAETDTLLNRLDALENYKADTMQTLRYRFLYKQLLAVKAELFLLSGGKLSFDEESKVLYDAVSPSFSKEHFEEILNKLNKILPGTDDVAKRFNDFRNQFIIPKDKIDTVFKAAIKACRQRTLQHIKLPADENFKVEYVKDKPWSGYNWYKGNYFSIIQVNTDLPIYIDRAVDLAAHEGYPGHHVYNSLLEENLVKKRRWMEFTVYPLFSPQSLIAEGTANYGIDVVFPGESRIKFEKDVLFPLAGLDSSKAEKYYAVLKLVNELSYADNTAAKNFLDGKWTKKETALWLEKYCLMTPEKAQQRIKFISVYRSYVINYNLGQDIVKEYIEKHGGTSTNPEKRWELFEHLLTTPQTPSGLRQ